MPARELPGRCPNHNGEIEAQADDNYSEEQYDAFTEFLKRNTSPGVNIIAAAELRKLTVQSEAAIALAIGYLTFKAGSRAVTIDADEIAEFSRFNVVTADTDDMGNMVYTIFERVLK